MRLGIEVFTLFQLVDWCGHFEYNTVLDTFRDPTLGAIVKNAKKERVAERWSKPGQGELKFNVDRAAKGCSGEAGIGVVLTDKDGHVKILFSMSIGVGDSTIADIRAIREAFLLFSASKWD